MEEGFQMQKYWRWSAIAAVLMLVLAACDMGDGTGSPGTGDGDAAAACAADEFDCVEIAEGDPILIGTALVITGENETLGLDSQYGVEVAAEMAGDIAGHPIEFNHQDDGCTTEGGTTAGQALVSEESLVAVIGTSCSSAGIPLAQIMSDAGILTVSSSNTAPSLTHPDTHEPFYARTAHNDEVQGLAMAQFVCEVLGLETAATIHDGSAYADQLAGVFRSSFESECGGTITADEAVSVGQTDFVPLLESIGTGSPEFLYFPVFVGEGALIANQAREATGLEDTILAGADGILTPDFLSAAGEAANGMYLSGPDLAFSGDFYQAEFLPAYTDFSGEDEPISVFHAHAFDAFNMIAQAIEEVAISEGGTTYIPRTALRDAFFGISDYQGITGNLTCNETGDCADPRISVSEVQDGAFVRIWPED